MKEYLDTLKTSQAKIICYGASEGGRRSLDILSDNGIFVDYFADTYKHGGLFHGIKVLSPEELLHIDKCEPVEVIITSSAATQIYQHLKNLGIKGRIGAMPLLYIINDPEILSSITEEGINHFSSAIAEMRQSLAEEVSLKVFDLLISARLSCKPEHYFQAYNLSVSASGKRQYLPSELHRRLTERPLSVVDCGAFTGDTVEEMAGWGISFAESWCFEPDSDNYKRLKKQITEFGLNSRVHPVNSGVFDKTSVLLFNKKGALDSRITEEGSESISVVALDDYLADKQIDFIKMDVEGAEMEALIGAKRIIERCRPILAISVYHRFNDITRIPLYLMNWLTDYSFMLRHYSLFISETIFYAIPCTKSGGY